MKPFISNLKRISILLCFGIGLALVLYNSYYFIRSEIYLLTPIENIYHQDIIVPNFKYGDDPVVKYSRTFGIDFNLIYDVTVRSIDSDIPVCRRDGSISYRKTDPAPSFPITLSRYMGSVCKFDKPGQYYIELHNIVKYDGYPDRLYPLRSNVFTVTF
jgi:hypothetical protein